MRNNEVFSELKIYVLQFKNFVIFIFILQNPLLIHIDEIEQVQNQSPQSDEFEDDPLLNSQYSKNEEASVNEEAPVATSSTNATSLSMPKTTLGTRSKKEVKESFTLPPEWFKFYNDKYMLSKATFAYVLPSTQGKIQCGCLDVRCFTKVNVLNILQFPIFILQK